MILPSALALPQRRNGSGNIAETFYLEVDGARVPFVLAGLRVIFNSGTGTADLVIGVDSYSGSLYDFGPLTVKGTGGGGNNYYMGTKHGQEKDWTFWTNPANPRETDGLTLAWTDPGTARP